jgi:hypothetical protein
MAGRLPWCTPWRRPGVSVGHRLPAGSDGFAPLRPGPPGWEAIRVRAVASRVDPRCGTPPATRCDTAGSSDGRHPHAPRPAGSTEERILISNRGLSAVRTAVSPARRRALGAKGCVLTADGELEATCSAGALQKIPGWGLSVEMVGGGVLGPAPSRLTCRRGEAPVARTGRAATGASDQGLRALGTTPGPAAAPARRTRRRPRTTTRPSRRSGRSRTRAPRRARRRGRRSSSTGGRSRSDRPREG